jgi:hypothetical protein
MKGEQILKILLDNKIDTSYEELDECLHPSLKQNILDYYQIIKEKDRLNISIFNDLNNNKKQKI